MYNNPTRGLDDYNDHTNYRYIRVMPYEEREDFIDTKQSNISLLVVSIIVILFLLFLFKYL